MIGQVQTIDGDKKVLPLAGSVPVGNPVGSFLYTYKKLRPRNYLYCDGSTFDENTYPALYLYLGTNVLPDYRECAMVGAEQNTTDTIATHDVYSQGEFKDDQIQDHTHTTTFRQTSEMYGGNNAVIRPSGSLATGSVSNTARVGATTHGKQKAVYVYIKAVDGVDISDEDTFLDTVKNFCEEKISEQTKFTDTNLTVIRQGGVVNIYCNPKRNTSGSWSDQWTLPEGFRPDNEIYFTGWYDGSSYTILYINATNGKIQIKTNHSSNIPISVSFMIDTTD